MLQNHSHLFLAFFVSMCFQMSITLPLDESNLIDIDPLPCHAEALKVSNFWLLHRFGLNSRNSGK